MKVIYTTDGVLVEIQTGDNPYRNETFKKGIFGGTKVSSSPLSISQSLELAVSIIAKRLETCELSELPIIMVELSKAEDLYEKWYEDEQRTW